MKFLGWVKICFFNYIFLVLFKLYFQGERSNEKLLIMSSGWQGTAEKEDLKKVRIFNEEMKGL